MKNLCTILAVIGIILAVPAVIGRFIGPPSIRGFSASGLLTLANTFLLLSLVVNSLKK